MNNRIDRKKIAQTILTAFALLAITAGDARSEEYCEGSLCFDEPETAAQHPDAAPVWAAAGSTGEVDDGSQNNYAVRGSDVYVKSNRTGTILMRYPVACKGTRIMNPYFAVRYKDDGSNARVRVRFVETDLYQGEETVRDEFDSDARPSSSEFQTYIYHPMLLEEGQLGYTYYGRYVGPTLLCSGKAYHYEVRLTRGPGGDPRVRMLSIEN